MKRLPLTVIGGFLGAGKTTLLNHWLRESKVRIAVLVNDFGQLNIDAELIASSSGNTIALTNGCVCCSIGDDLSDALIRVLSSSAQFDAIVIEASGVSDPWRIAQVGLADPGLSLDGVIVLVDASAALDQARDVLLADSLERQLKSADLVVMNKIDLVDEQEKLRVREWITTVAGLIPIFETRQADVPLRLLSGIALSASMAKPSKEMVCGHGDHEHKSHFHNDMFDTWSCQPNQTYSAQVLRLALKAMPADVLRLKGFVRTDEHGWAELQFSGRHGSLCKANEMPECGAAVVAIGLQNRLPRVELNSLFGL